MRSYDLTPLYRTSVGFDRLSRLMESALTLDGQTSYPPYNIVKRSENDYRISLAVAGFGEDEIEIVSQNGTLTVKGRSDVEDDFEYLHRGIAGRAFERRFQLADHVEVLSADLVNGLLHIELRREIPEVLKPRRIAIGSQADAVAAK
jgi:molecular chaperone IbpA